MTATIANIGLAELDLTAQEIEPKAAVVPSTLPAPTS